MKIKKEKIKVYDMTCNSCENRVERSLKALEGIVSVKASYSKEQVLVEYDAEICDIDKIKESVKVAGYSVKNSNSYKVIGIFIVAAAIIFLGSTTGGFDMNAKLNGASYIVLFIIGMLTSIHCVGMCGGIMLSQSISKKDVSKFQAIRPAILYNSGRVIAYTAIGGIVGALGSVLSLSLAVKSAMQIFAGVFMIILGLNMAGFGVFRKINLKVPWSACSVKNKPTAPFLIGLLNGLMPCGPLQTMQLYALGTGSAVKGAISMFLFSLGTVPLMLTFGALSGLLSKGYTKKILKMSGFLVIILGIIMGNRGLALSGIGIPSFMDLTKDYVSSSSSESDIGKAVLKDGIQEITMIVDGNGFTPNQFYVKKDVPVKWVIKGDSINPCNNAIAIPTLNIENTIKSGENIIEFTPSDKDINFSCWMGMIKGTIKVIDNLDMVDTSKSDESIQEERPPSIYGDDLNQVSTDRLIKKTTVSDNIQSIDIRGIGYELEPLIIVANKGMNTRISLDLRAFDTSDEKLKIINSDTKENITSADVIKGIITMDVKLDKVGKFAIVNSSNVLTVIQVVDDINSVDLEKVREQYFSK
ncbi:heavy metal transport/detoxification protein [Clostridium chromiireducens]|uniref:Heavy metal transport/detoxification protein n=1 Tax=Clostridium chromiireducens TaxID=225345 RepID=A0A399IGA4_9CLOT|nr:sulfite exporter TauE/SafE family protein [Clostridium chromiireducens]RII31878.1 heavy metal transport/detoxification protein [Clostridium chromiireducens]